jgi:hypothetical protein
MKVKTCSDPINYDNKNNMLDTANWSSKTLNASSAAIIAFVEANL